MTEWQCLGRFLNGIKQLCFGLLKLLAKKGRVDFPGAAHPFSG
jgi:hypothetical protein